MRACFDIFLYPIMLHVFVLLANCLCVCVPSLKPECMCGYWLQPEIWTHVNRLLPHITALAN